MMNKTRLENIHRRVRGACAEEQAIIAAYVFGSLVKNSGREPRDVDIALVLDESKADSFSLLSFMVGLEKSLDRPVDVVVLNRAGEVLKYEVRRSGMVVYDRDPQMRKRFEITGRKTYEDFLHLHRRYVNAVLYGGKDG